MRINKKYAPIVSGLIISILLAFGISFVMSLINQIPLGSFIFTWIRSSLLGFSIGYPLSRIIVPTVIRAVDRYVDKD